MKYNYFDDDTGLSLLEVLIGMLIVAIGLLGLAPMITVSVEGNVTSRDASAAANLAKETIEFYEGLDTLPTMPVNNAEENLLGKYLRATYVRGNATDSLIPAGAYKVDVFLTWEDNQDVRRSTQYTTLILEP